MQLAFSILLLFFVQTSIATAQVFDGNTLQRLEVSDVVDRIHPGTIVIMGEVHDSEEHHQNQRDLLVLLAQKSSLPAVSVGMEFIDYTQQSELDDFLNKKISEELFLKNINWGGIPFYHYRFQVKLPPYRNGWTYGINLPRRITSKVGKGGLESLDPEELSLLPPQFEMGNANYFERFESTMKGHVPEEAILKYFTAQSLWDDTMAWKSLEAMRNNPEQTLVIMVGDFHAAWGHGLASRLRARGAQDVLVITQVQGLDKLAVHPKYGARGDFVFVSKEPKSRHSLFDELITSFTYRH